VDGAISPSIYSSDSSAGGVSNIAPGAETTDYGNQPTSSDLRGLLCNVGPLTNDGVLIK
jgi:hypothetical protein